MELLGQAGRVVGMDIVEFTPSREVMHIMAIV
jgi:arginase family enzyme